MRVLRILRTAVRYEIGIWRSLAIWLLRLRRVPAGAHAHPYAGALTPLLIVFIVVSAIELPILHLVLPWETVRLVADLLGVWGLLWMIGLLAAVRVHPHAVSEDGIRVRSGFSLDLTLPWEAIASVRARGRSLERSRTVQYEQTPAGQVASVAVASQTTVDITLRRPLVLALPGSDGSPVVELRIHVDDPGPFLAQVRQRTVTA